MMTSNRYIENKFADYTEDCDCMHDGKPSTDFLQKAKLWISANVEVLLTNIPKLCTNENDFSVYTGTTGIAFLLLHLADTIYKQGEYKEQLIEAVNLVFKSTKRAIQGRKISFLCGDAGPLSLAAINAHREGDSQQFAHCIKALTSMLDRCCNDVNVPDEMLNGRSGYLYSLLLVRKYCGNASISDTVLDKVCCSIIASGEKLAKKDRTRIPLKYIWHDKEYIGAAHGYFGIFFTLLQPDLSRLPVIQNSLHVIKDCIDVMLSMRFPSGNFPSSVGSQNDRLVQWCHGSPAAVDTLARAYELFEDSKYLEAAEKCCDVIWERGLLQKGYGTCHGAAGNGYSFLTMYNLTKNEKYLYRALKLFEDSKYLEAAEKCCDVIWERGLLQKGYGTCHGAAGNGYSFLTMYNLTKNEKYLYRALKLFEDSKYLEAAEKCCDVIWERGLLQKGYGTCHGAAGNGYSFLTMYNLTKNEKYLYRALKFGEWCLEFGQHGCRTPDRPLSLYEGLAGTVNFVADLMHPSEPNFIGYHLR